MDYFCQTEKLQNTMQKLLLTTLGLLLTISVAFSQDATPIQAEISNLTKEELRHQGEMDARKFYKKYKGASFGTLGVSLVSPLVGLVPAVITSATEPKYENLGFPNAELMKNPDYSSGYIKKSKKIKQGKVWTNFGIGLGANLLASIIYFSAN